MLAALHRKARATVSLRRWIIPIIISLAATLVATQASAARGLGLDGLLQPVSEVVQPSTCTGGHDAGSDPAVLPGVTGALGVLLDPSPPPDTGQANDGPPPLLTGVLDLVEESTGGVVTERPVSVVDAAARAIPAAEPLLAPVADVLNPVPPASQVLTDATGVVAETGQDLTGIVSTVVPETEPILAPVDATLEHLPVAAGATTDAAASTVRALGAAVVGTVEGVLDTQPEVPASPDAPRPPSADPSPVEPAPVEPAPVPPVPSTPAQSVPVSPSPVHANPSLVPSQPPMSPVLVDDGPASLAPALPVRSGLMQDESGSRPGDVVAGPSRAPAPVTPPAAASQERAVATGARPERPSQQPSTLKDVPSVAPTAVGGALDVGTLSARDDVAPRTWGRSIGLSMPTLTTTQTASASDVGGVGPVAAMLALVLFLVLIRSRWLGSMEFRRPTGIAPAVPTPPG